MAGAQGAHPQVLDAGACLPTCTPYAAYNALQEGLLVLDARAPPRDSLLLGALDLDSGSAADWDAPDSLRGGVVIGSAGEARTASACAAVLARWPALAPGLRLLPAAAVPALAAAFPFALQVATAPAFAGPLPAAIGPGVFLGSAWHASERECLARCGFTHIVCCMREPGGCSPAAAAALALHCAHFPWEDEEAFPLLQDLPAAVAAVEAGRASAGGRGRVLLHCWVGASRSAAAAAAWLLWRQGGTVQEAHAALQAARCVVRINSGFLAQLEAWRQRVAAAGGPGCDLGAL